MSSSKDTEKTKSSKENWTKHQELLLLTWAERASGYAWLHSQSVHYYKRMNLCISVPSSVFGYIAGATTLLSDATFNVLWVKGVVGMAGILAGLMANFQQMFTFKEISELHRISSLRFLSYYRDINCELKLHHEHRTSPIEYITMKRMELDKMLEQSPNIPKHIIDEFNMRFNKSLVYKPQLSNILQTFVPYGWTSQDVKDFNNGKRVANRLGRSHTFYKNGQIQY